MRWSQTLIPTLRDDPQEADIQSHKLMMRAGLIRKLAGGLYTFMPLGLRALRNVERIVREEMDRAGALEVLMPALQPREIWEQSGRFETMSDVMFNVKDRQDRHFVLGPTHEEVITELVSREISSYRQLPRTFYQIQNKFRDEIRPRFGLMRAKEFSMKDAYSFDTSWNDADASYQAMYDAYQRIFQRCGLKTKVVEADTGAMGGKWSHEFMVLADSGEDGIVECTACEYAANVERGERMMPSVAVFPDAERPLENVSTPGVCTIDEVSAFLRCGPERLIKTLIYHVDGNPVAVLVPGDRDVNEHKLRRALEASTVALADDAAIQAVTGAPVGFAGPVGLTIRIVADVGLKGAAGLIAGANQADTHVRNIDLARDTTITAYHDLVIARDGDGCPRCGGALREMRGIEVGHVFKLGTKYSQSFHAVYLDAEGQQQLIVMGCYGIGVTRTLQAVIEQNYDENGIIWPVSVAPYPVSILVMNPGHEPSRRIAEQLEAALAARGLESILDDRDERPGVKFKDADLLGFPIRVVIGERSLAKGGIEVRRRRDGQTDLVAVDNAVDHIIAVAAGLKPAANDPSQAADAVSAG